MDTRILDARSPSESRAAIAVAARLLLDGALVAFPTETVYGLGANATDAQAIARVFRAKGRPSDNPLIVHVAEAAAFQRCALVDERVELLARAFMPGPLTVVLRALDSIPAIARGGLPTVALRIPDHPVALRLLELAGPLVGPSANLSGRPSPTTAQHVMHDLAGRIDAVLDGGPCHVGIESTVLDLTHGSPVILRPGRISTQEIEDVLGVGLGAASTPHERRSPGTRYRHYAPRASVELVVSDTPPAIGHDSAHVRVMTTPAHSASFRGIELELLSEPRLYASLREADEQGVQRIVIYARPGELPDGLLDRVRRASGDPGL